MGSWTANCALSGLSYNEDCPAPPGKRLGVVFIISRASPVEMAFDPDDYCRPLGPPLWGEYDGYGGISVADDPAVVEIVRQRLAAVLDRHLEDVSVGAAQEEIGRNGASLRVWRPTGFLNEPGRARSARLGVMLVREDVWHRVCDAEEMGAEAWSAAVQAATALPDWHDPDGEAERLAFWYLTGTGGGTGGWLRLAAARTAPPSVVERFIECAQVAEVMRAVGRPWIPALTGRQDNNSASCARYFRAMAEMAEGGMAGEKE